MKAVAPGAGRSCARRRDFAAMACCALLVAGCEGQPIQEDALSEAPEEPPSGPTALADFTPEIALELQWQRPLGDGQGRRAHRRLRLALDADRLVAAAANGTLCALDRRDGSPHWCRRLPDGISGGVAVGQGLALAGTERGVLVALDIDSGKTRWRARLDGEILAPAAVDGALVVVQTANGKVHGLSSDTGEALWVYRSELPNLMLRGTATPVLAESLAVCGFANGLLAALRRSDGLPIWERRLVLGSGRSALQRLIDIDGTPLLSRGVIYAVSYQGNLASMNLATGETFWRAPASSLFSPISGFGNAYVVDDESRLLAFDGDDGEAQWEQVALSRRGLGPPVELLGYIVAVDAQGWVHALSQVDGHVSGRIFAGSAFPGPGGGPRRRDRPEGYAQGFAAPPIVEEDWLYLLSDAGRISAYRARLLPEPDSSVAPAEPSGESAPGLPDAADDAESGDQDRGDIEGIEGLEIF